MLNSSSQSSKAPPPPGSSDACAALLANGKAAARAGRKAEARFFFNQVLEIDPSHSEALLWLAYLAGGGRRSLAFLVRVLESAPENPQARAAIRWARSRATPQSAQPAKALPARPSKRAGYIGRSVAAALVVFLGLIVGLATAAFVLERPSAEPTRAQVAALPTSASTAVPVAAANVTPTVHGATANVTPTVNAATTNVTPEPTEEPVLFPSHTPTPTETPSPTPSPTPLPTATQRPTATATNPPPTATATAAPPTPTPTAAPATPTSTQLPTAPIGDSFRWIDVDLTNQRLVAYEGERPVRSVIVSTGLPRTPTVTGRFKIYVKYRAARMSGPGYDLPGVPYVMYFYRGYGLHGTYWHNNFGRPMSHGCVNLPTPEAEWLFNWASVGTPVVVHY
jgi:lipoprotein-anchoring transpeptidase ErfK/SrfK